MKAMATASWRTERERRAKGTVVPSEHGAQSLRSSVELDRARGGTSLRHLGQAVKVLSLEGPFPGSSAFCH